MNEPFVVAVSQRVDMVADRAERRDALDQRLIAFLVESGFLPVPVPNRLGIQVSMGQADHRLLDDWIRGVKPQAVVLSGGNDIGECPDRDLTERRLLEHARHHALAVLGICRGMQMMGVWAGGGLTRVTGHVRSRHSLQIVDPPGGSREVNSFHDWSLSQCPERFLVTARSEDGEIEAIRHTQLPWEGWMWHPEREPSFSAEDIDRARRLFLSRATR